MTAIKREFGGYSAPASYGVRYKRQSFMGARSFGGSQYRRKWVPRAEYLKRFGRRTTSSPSSALDKVASLVEARLKKAPASKGPSKNIIMYSSSSIAINAGHDNQTITFLPVTQAIPSERRAGDPADDRFRTSNSIYLTGVRVRFTIKYTGAFRIRMALYKPTTETGVANFGFGNLPGVAQMNPNQVFGLNWYDLASSGLLPDGPFACHSTDKAEGANPTWNLESSDGTIFQADLGKGTRQPLKDYSIRRGPSSVNSSAETCELWDVDWYVPIGKNVSFSRESNSDLMDMGYQIVFFYDVPSLDQAARDISQQILVALIPHISLKIYYR